MAIWHRKALKMLDETHIHLKPKAWTQVVNRNDKLNISGLSIRTHCTTLSSHDLILADNRKLSDLRIDLGVMPGDVSPTHRTHARLSEQAIGGVWWTAKDGLVHGWFYLQGDDFKAVWDQIHDGGYVNCTISLELSPVNYGDKEHCEWVENPMSILSASINFERNIDRPVEVYDKHSKILSPYSGRGWAGTLFALAAVTLFSHWIGLQLYRPMTADDIVAAVLFVGGLLLWFGSYRHG